MTPKVELRDVVKSYSGEPVLRDVELSVGVHEVVCLIGSSGSGKSTVLKCINLLVPIDAGDILFDGESIAAGAVNPNMVREKMGIVFQGFNLFPHMTVGQNITLSPIRVHSVPRSQAAERAEELLDRFGLLDKLNEYPDKLSGGQQQRVAIVRSLATRPELMLFDEVTSALDPELVAEVLEVIRGLKDEGMTMIIATHEMGFARDVGDRVCFLDDGVILESGPAKQFFANPQQPRTRQFLQRIIDAGRM